MKPRSRVSEFFHDARTRISSAFSTNWTQITRIVKRRWIGVVIATVAISIPVGALVLAVRLGRETQLPPSDPHVGFYPNPDTRGTINIISMCLLTIFLCVYVVVHPNVDETDAMTQTGLALLALLAPECLLTIAMNDFLVARRGRLWMRSRGFSQWTMTHVFTAHMGCLTFEGARGGPHVLSRLKSKDIYDWVCRNANPATHAFDYDGILKELKDRSNHNSLAKALVVLQALNVAVQVIACATQSLPVTELELTTCSYIVCTLAIYVVWWDKPYCIHEHVVLRLESATHSRDQKPDSGLEVTGTKGQSLLSPHHHISSDSEFDEKLTKTENILIGLAGACFALIVGTIHAVAWNATFITSYCQILWRICCILHLICPTLAIAMLLHGSSKSDVVIGIYLMIFFFCILPYVLSRALLFMLVGLSFWSQPVDVYVEVKWLSFVPQWS